MSMEQTPASMVRQWQVRAEVAEAERDRIANLHTKEMTDNIKAFKELHTRIRDLEAASEQLAIALRKLSEATGAEPHGDGWLLPYFNADGTQEMLTPQGWIELRRAAAVRLCKLEKTERENERLMNIIARALKYSKEQCDDRIEMIQIILGDAKP